MWKTTFLQLSTAAAIALTCASAPALAADNTTPAPVETQAAVWTPKEVQFTYMGFTTHFTCDGLRDTVREMLLQLGARRDDLKVYEQPCSRPDHPDPFPGVKIKMSVLQPAPGTPGAPPTSPPGAAAPGTDGAPVDAYWKTIKLPYRTTALEAAGQCELLEQFKQKILPLFTTRNVDLHASCVPHQLEPIGTMLQAEVLVTDQKKVPGKQASAAEAR